MRERVLKAIAAAGRAAPETPHKRTTWELASAVREADAQRDWRLLQHPARLRIQTIDALNSSLARRLPVLAGAGAAIEPTDDPWPLYEAACARLIERLGDGSEAAGRLEHLIVHLANRVDRIIVLLSELLAKRDQWLHPIVARAAQRGPARDARNSAARRRRTASDERSASGWETSVAANCWRSPSTPPGICLRTRRLHPRAAVRSKRVSVAHRSSPDAACLPAWRAAAALLFTQKNELYASVNVRQGFPPTNAALKTRMLSMLRTLGADETVCEQLARAEDASRPGLREEQWRMLEALLAAAAGRRRRAAARLPGAGRRRTTSKSRCARCRPSARRMSRPTSRSRSTIDCSTSWSMSSRTRRLRQLDLLERLTAGWADGDGRTLFCVGDPMQSIYRFRQAEVGLFLQSAASRTAQRARSSRCTLSANFRSDPAVVAWVNGAFPGCARADRRP